jgi:hypothetical protein
MNYVAIILKNIIKNYFGNIDVRCVGKNNL